MNKKYFRYKDTSLFWLGEIPEPWSLVRFKNLAIIKNGKDQKEVLIEEGGFPVFGTGGEFGRASQYLHDKPSVLLGRKGTINRPQYTEEPFWTVDTLFYTEIRNDVNPKYLFYLSQIMPFDLLQESSAVPSMTQEKLRNVTLCKPDLYEQNQIVRYLNHQCNIIDDLIDKKEQLIERLHELRQATLNEAVTKGLDQNVKMKDCGIMWLGEIPQDWKILPLKLLGKIKYGLGQPPRIKEGGLPLIRATNIERGRIVKKDLIFVDPDDVPFERDPVLKENDIIVVRSGAYTADSAIIPKEYEGAITGYDMVITCYNINPKFMAFALLSDYLLTNQLLVKRSRAAQPHLNAEELGNSWIIVPPDEIQNVIIEQLSVKIQLLDDIKYEVKLSIEQFKKYRQSLISETVTGKIDVREWQTPN